MTASPSPREEAADVAARTISDRLDLPLGSLTAFVGVPYFLLALRVERTA